MELLCWSGNAGVKSRTYRGYFMSFMNNMFRCYIGIDDFQNKNTPSACRAGAFRFRAFRCRSHAFRFKSSCCSLLTSVIFCSAAVKVDIAIDVRTVSTDGEHGVRTWEWRFGVPGMGSDHVGGIG